MIVQVRDANKSFGSQELFKDLSVLIKENEKVALIGANGVGKTTLFRVLSGEESLDSGDVFWKTGMRRGFLEQIHISDEKVLVKDYFDEVFVDVFALRDRLQELEELMKTDHSEKVLNQYDRIQTEFMRRGGYTYETEIHTILTQFNFSVSDLERDLNTFSGGQVTRLAFIRLLLSKPDILFLDEPTNHLDISTIEWLEGYLNSYDGAVVVVSHDRLFLDRVCNVVVEIEDMEATRYESNYSGYQKIKETAIERHNIKFQNQQREIERIEKLIEKFRYKKNKAAFAQSKIKYLDRMDKLEKKDVSTREFKAEFKARLRGGKEVLSVNELQVGYDKPLFEYTGTFMKGRRYAIVGDNGTGKSTLLKTVSGRMEPLKGEIMLGHQIEMGYFDQQLLDFTMNKTVLEEVWDAFPGLDHTEIRTALGRFLFKGKMSSNLSMYSRVASAFVWHLLN
ncbi:ABC-F family ATP-binding cassette domain-containing protein [Erysipelothrix sp. HDW6C]|uniref:ABC-F family ATP-binding cassette domain-containing protein n=1 Tax=Erysipelothrix sp. HDW6C TaxID=2714930 RepID=UPI00352FB5A9